jgi:hypothetical protein
MKLNEVLDIAVMYLGLDGEIKTTGENRTPVTNPKLRTLIKCANVVYSEIASDYMRLPFKEEITAVEGRIVFTSFTRRVIDVVSVRKDGAVVPFTVYPDYLEVDADGALEIKYHYLPNELELDSDIAAGISLTIATFAAGIAGEYALINGMYEESVAYERKFKEGILSNLQSARPKYLKCGRWLR